MKVIRGPWSKGVQICSPGGVQIRSPRAEADHWVFKSAVVSQGNLGIDVAGQVGTAAPVFDSASGVPVSDSARPVTLSCNTWVYPLVEGKDAKPVRIVVHAPLASWGWAAKSDRLYTGNQTAIPEVRGQAPRHYYYDANHSADIWRCSMAFQQQSLSCIGGQEAAAAQGTETVAAARVRSRTPLRRKRCSMPFQQRSLSCIGGQEAAAAQATKTVAAARERSRTPLRRKRPRRRCQPLRP